MNSYQRKCLADLNKRCLLEIFKYLNLKELAVLSTIYTNFDKAILVALLDRHTFVTSFFIYRFYGDIQIQKFLEKFSTSLAEYRFDLEREDYLIQYMNEAILKSIDIYIPNFCNEKIIKLLTKKLSNVKSLTFRCKYVSTTRINILLNKTSQLHELVLHIYCNLKYDNIDFDNLLNLKSLSLYFCCMSYASSQFLMKIGKNLLKLQIYYTKIIKERKNCNCHNLKYFSELITTSTLNLTHLLITGSRDCDCVDYVSHKYFIFNFLFVYPFLISVSFHFFFRRAREFHFLVKLKNLKVLEIEVDFHTGIESFPKITPKLEKLSIRRYVSVKKFQNIVYSAYENEYFATNLKGLKFLKNLREFAIRDLSVDEFNLIKIIFDGLPHLTKLRIEDYDFEIEEEQIIQYIVAAEKLTVIELYGNRIPVKCVNVQHFYTTITNIVKNRKTKLKLDIYWTNQITIHENNWVHIYYKNGSVDIILQTFKNYD